MSFTIIDDIIKQRRSEKKKQQVHSEKDNRRGGGRNRNKNKNQMKMKMMMDTSPILGNNRINKGKGKGGIQKQQHQQRFNRRNENEINGNGPKLIIRSNSGHPRPSSFSKSSSSINRSQNYSNYSSTPGLRQPWEKLPAAPLPLEPLRISIHNELADRPGRRSDEMMMDTDSPMNNGHSYNHNHRRNDLTPVYEPRDSLANREEYRLGSRFSTQGMPIDYQLPSGASYDTRPSRRY